MQVVSEVRRLTRKLSPGRRVVYGIPCAAIAVGIIAKGVHLHHISQYRKGKECLEMSLEKDQRLRNVHIFFSPTRPSASVLAPRDLPLNAKRELERLVADAFRGLPVRIQYAGPEVMPPFSEGVGHWGTNRVNTQ